MDVSRVFRRDRGRSRLVTADWKEKTNGPPLVPTAVPDCHAKPAPEAIEPANPCDWADDKGKVII